MIAASIPADTRYDHLVYVRPRASTLDCSLGVAGHPRYADFAPGFSTSSTPPRSSRASSRPQNSHRDPSVFFCMCRVATSPFSRLVGMLWGEVPVGYGLLITRCRAVHTLGMRFPIDIYYLARLEAKGYLGSMSFEVVQVSLGTEPWRFPKAVRAATDVLEVRSTPRIRGVENPGYFRARYPRLCESHAVDGAPWGVGAAPMPPGRGSANVEVLPGDLVTIVPRGIAGFGAH